MSIQRFEGRLFAEGGTLFMVLKTDEARDTARVSCRLEGQHVTIDMSLSEVASRVAAGSNLMLDNLNGPNAEKRLLQADDGWYFSAREGRMGPFNSKAEAAVALGRYVLSMQAQPQATDRRSNNQVRRPDHRASDFSEELRAAS